MEPIVKNSIKEIIAEQGQPEQLGEKLIKYFELDSEGQMTEGERKKFLELFVDNIVTNNRS